MSKEKYYLTTPIYYINDKPHIGHAYTTIVADFLARLHRLRGEDVMFLTGTDENSQKNVEALKAKTGQTAEPTEKEVKVYLNEMSAIWQAKWDTLGITNDDFIRTTEPRHHQAVEQFWKKVWDKGDIYLGNYVGLYCSGCENFVIESDLVDGKCPHHKISPKQIKEKNYFFRLANYREQLLEYIEKHPQFIQPVSRKNEVTSYIREFMEDVSISRENMKWGIAVPVKDEPAGQQAIYVWFDALINYLSGIGYGSDEKKFNRLWPADLHLVGKDIIKFHCALWPAMLLSAGLPLPKTIFAHGFFTINGEKMSKSLKNVIDPEDVIRKYGNDTLRYYLLREIPFGEDGDFSFARLEERHNADLANGIGNLAARVLAMVEKFCNGKVPAAVASDHMNAFWAQYEHAVAAFKFHDCLRVIVEVVHWGDSLIDKEKPWALMKENQTERINVVLYTLLETLRHLAFMAWPVIPEATEKLFEALGQKGWSKVSLEEAKTWGGLKAGTKVKAGLQLFPKIESTPKK